MEINRTSARLIFSIRYVLLKDNIFAMHFMKKQFKTMAPLD